MFFITFLSFYLSAFIPNFFSDFFNAFLIDISDQKGSQILPLIDVGHYAYIHRLVRNELNRLRDTFPSDSLPFISGAFYSSSPIALITKCVTVSFDGWFFIISSTFSVLTVTLERIIPSEGSPQETSISFLWMGMFLAPGRQKLNPM